VQCFIPKGHIVSKWHPLEDYISKGIQREEVCLGGYIYIYIYIYGLNESSFYQVGACLQVESCHEDWIPHISVGSEINKSVLL
jgi:hypothetical protein